MYTEKDVANIYNEAAEMFENALKDVNSDTFSRELIALKLHGYYKLCEYKAMALTED